MPTLLTEAQKSFVQYLEDSGKAHATVIAYGKDIEQLVENAAGKGKLYVTEVAAEDIDEFKELLKRP